MAAPMKLSFFPALFQWTKTHTSVVFTRSRHKINIQHPRPGHIQREILVKVTAPIIPEVKVDPSQTCTRRDSLPNQFQILSEYERFLIRHQTEILERNADGILAFFHLGSCTSNGYKKHRVALRKQGFDVWRLNRKVFHHAVKGTQYETLNTVLCLSTVLVMCEEPRVADMLAVVKKLPPYYLLCAVVEGHLLSKTQVEVYAALPDKLSLLAQTCATLNQPPQRISQLLTSQQEQLVHSLKTYSEPES